MPSYRNACYKVEQLILGKKAHYLLKKGNSYQLYAGEKLGKMLCSLLLPKQINLKEERFLLACDFRSPIRGQLAPLPLCLWQGKNIMVEEYGRGKLLTLYQEKSRGRE
jgi:hypothetical protein